MLFHAGMRLRRFILLLLPLYLAPATPARAQGFERAFANTLRQEVARIREEQRQENINAKYLIEAVEVRGVPDRDLGRSLDDDRKAIVGERLDSEPVARFENRLRDALPEYNVTRRTVKGSEPGRIRLIFEARRADWARMVRFEAQDANLIYHSDQGWGSRIPLSINAGDVLISPVFAFDIGDELVEEYGGFGVRIESRRLGTDRLGLLFDWSSFEQTWRGATLDAIALAPGVPALYRNRRTLTPLLKIGLTRHVSIDAGVRVTELDALEEGGESRMANAAMFAINFSRQPRESAGPRHGFEAAFTVRAGTEALESDLTYERYLGQAQYTQRRGRQRLTVFGQAGRIDGDAPVFERFTLGDSRTLRGWDKYDIAPIGGTRVAYGSIEYRYRGFGTFADAGSIWTEGGERKLRTSTGLTFHSTPFFMTVGFPLNTDEFRAVFTMGLRFSTASLSKY